MPSPWDVFVGSAAILSNVGIWMRFGHKPMGLFGRSRAYRTKHEITHPTCSNEFSLRIDINSSFSQQPGGIRSEIDFLGNGQEE